MIELAITTDHIRASLTAYLARYAEEEPELEFAIGLIEAGADLTSRKEFRGHVTAGAILADPDGRVLHIHHLATGKWLLPGGHLESVDSTLLEAAGRELTEETGIAPDAITPVGDSPLHIDVHPIPANPSKEEPDHQHIDFRFLFRTTADIGPLQTEEIGDAAWRSIDSLHDERLRRRVARALC
ncbi:NUDIX hydrolase [Streptomyces cucumeris]|uniref:NUDIX hydrolase n=1 Tax=Streptomyces cucumeris TaxID=2962890 RepID=UPI003D731117